MNIEIKKLTPELVDDFFRFFEHIAFPDHPEWGCGCYCCFFHANNIEEWENQTVEENREIARKMILSDKMKGLLAYADGKPVGWCHFDDKSKLPGLKVFYPQVIGNEENIGAIVCFTIAQQYRNKGIAKKLLSQACGELEKQGFLIAEAYPQRECASDEENYHGPLSMYLSQGFSVHKELEKEVIVRKYLRN